MRCHFRGYPSRHLAGGQVVVALLVGLAGPGAAASAPALNVQALVGLSRVTDAAIAPDGRHVAYVREVPRQLASEPDGPAWRRLHLIGGDGRSRELVDGRVRVRQMAWDAGGGSITYLLRRDGSKHDGVYRVRLGGKSELLWLSSTPIERYAIDASGLRLAYVTRDALSAARARRRQQGFDARVVGEQERFSRVWVVDLRRGRQRVHARRLSLEGSASLVAWRPDGAQLMVALAPSPTADDYLLRRRLHLVDPRSGRVSARLQTPGMLGAAAYSPDGSQIALLATLDPRDPQPGRLLVATAPGGQAAAAKPVEVKLRPLLPRLKGDVRAFAWRDARSLVYAADVGLQSEVGVVAAAGDRREVWLAPAAGRPIWRSVGVSRDGGQVVLVGDRREHPAEVYRVTAGGKQLRRLTRHNPILSRVSLAVQEPIDFRARDGVALQGILVRPAGDPPKGGWPLVLFVHGGPASHVADGWVSSFGAPAQLAAARGLAVFFPNYRGSSGRGAAFAMLGQGDYGGREFDDLVDAIGYLSRKGIVDRRRVGIVGGSYGGYAAAWAATKLTRHFAAAVMIAGISEHVSKLGTTIMPEHTYRLYARRWPWQAWRWYHQRSPLSWVAQARTPLLIAHGDADRVVHSTQAMMLHRFLAQIGKVPVRLVLYPGEGHGLRRASSRQDLCRRVLRWLGHYLSGPGGTPPPAEW